jgi:hypothetical protein
MAKASHRFDNAKRRRSENHDRQRMLTPSYILEPIRSLLGSIDLDPCTEPDNPTGAAKFYCPPMDGCTQSWDEPRIFCNPPYGQARERWVDRCIEAGKRSAVVLLLPSHTETRIFQRALFACTTVLFVQARIRFGVLRKNRRQEAASHGSALFGFGVDLTCVAIDGVPMKPVCGDDWLPTRVKMVTSLPSHKLKARGQYPV